MASVKNILEASKREEFGKGASRRIRREGNLPVVVYGHGEDPKHLTVNYHDAFLIVRSNANALLTLTKDGEDQLVIVKDIQRNPLSRLMEHIDLLRVKRDEKVDVEVLLEIVGEPLNDAIATLELMTLPVKAPVTDIPEAIIVNVEGVADGTNLTVADLELPEGVTTDLDPEEVIVVVAIPQEVAIPEAEVETVEDEEAEEESGEDAE